MEYAKGSDDSDEKPKPLYTSHWVGIKRNASPPYVGSSELLKKLERAQPGDPGCEAIPKVQNIKS
jgi:hypothetical protein